MSIIYTTVSPYSFAYPLSVLWGIANHSFTLTNPSATQNILINSNGDSGNLCTYWIMTDVTFIIYLCSPFCLACTSY